MLTLVSCVKKVEQPVPRQPVSRGDAIALALAEARKQGIDPDKYTLDRFGDETSAGPDKFVFAFACKPIPSPPGCMFLAVVDKRVGKVRIERGQ
jgi:hypothetical protein